MLQACGKSVLRFICFLIVVGLFLAHSGEDIDAPSSDVLFMDKQAPYKPCRMQYLIDKL